MSMRRRRQGDVQETKGRSDAGSDVGANALSLTTDQLKKRADLVAVDGFLYDLEGMAPHHPGGEVIRASGAYDASALFHSMHPGKDPEKSTLLRKFRVGVHARREGEDPIYVFDSPFAKDLVRTVRRTMSHVGEKSWYAPTYFWIRTAIIAAMTLLCEYKWMIGGYWVWGVLCGCMHAQIGLSIQHDASHGAISSNPWINSILAYGADWIGNSRWIWFQQHILWHHPHTNHQRLDPDARSAEPFLVFNDYTKKGAQIPEPPKPSRCARFQDLFTHAVLSLYGVSVVYNPYVISMRHNEHVPESLVAHFMSQKKPVAWLWRLFYVARMVILPWMWGEASLLCSLLLVNTVTGILLTSVFVISHNFEDSDRDPCRLSKGAETRRKGQEGICWYRAQVETSCSYGGTLGMLLTGGLNLQIEHHLFPRLCSWYYPSIRSAVRECCERHSVKYRHYPTISSNVASMLRYMRRVGIVVALQHAGEA